MLGIVANFYCAVFAVVFDGDFADFNTIDDFVFLAAVFFVERHLEESSVKPESAEIGYAVECLASNNGEILPEGPFGHLGSFYKGAETIALCLVGVGDFFFPVVVELLFADAENFLDGSVECHAVVFGHLMPNLGHGIFAVFFADVAD